jgi:predicted phosphodiesterase
VGGVFVKKLDFITLSGKKILFTHGDLYGVKYGMDGITSLARENGADIALFGHTHIPLERYISDGERPLYLFNPGSAGAPYRCPTSYGIIQISDKGVLFSHGAF